MVSKNKRGRRRFNEGKPLPCRPSPLDLIRFLNMVKMIDGHWLWQGHLDKNGYGQFRFNGSAMGAHRFSAQAFKGAFPKGHQAHHEPHCLRHDCVHPDHLSGVTEAFNIGEGNKRILRGACKQRMKVKEEIPF